MLGCMYSRDEPKKTAGWTRRAGLCLLLGLILVCLAWAAPPPGPPGKTESDRVSEAHREIESAEVTVRFAPYFSYPDETEFLAIDYRVVLDRKAGRVRVERPGYTLVSDGKDILLVADDLPGRHLRMPLNGALTYERLVEVFPDLTDPVPPALVLMLSDEPMLWLSGGASDSATRVAPNQADGDPKLLMRLPTQFGHGELRLDSKTRHISTATFHVDQQQLAGSGLDAVQFHYDIQWQSLNKPIDKKHFELDLKGSTETTTLAQFLAPPAHGGNAAAGGAGGPGAPNAGGTLIGQTLPDMDLALLGGDKTINLSKHDKGLVVVEFFASWTRPSVLDLPALADFKKWCADNDHEVSIYAVAVGETPESMEKWLAALEKTAGREVDLPVLLDPKTEAAMALRLPTVPRTMIVVDGKIVEVYGGVKAEFLEDLKKGYPQWAKEQDPAEE